MILNDDKIIEYCLNEDMITPFVDWQLQPASYDLTLSNEFYKDGERLDGPTYTLESGEFVLASTVEYVNIPSGLCARVEGKSSLGRLGLMVHCTAGFIDPGFQGRITLELYNLGVKPIVLHEGVSISQICFMKLVDIPSSVYGDSGLGSHYQGQDGVLPSRYDSGDEWDDVHLVLD